MGIAQSVYYEFLVPANYMKNVLRSPEHVPKAVRRLEQALRRRNCPSALLRRMQRPSSGLFSENCTSLGVFKLRISKDGYNLGRESGNGAILRTLIVFLASLVP